MSPAEPRSDMTAVENLKTTYQKIKSEIAKVIIGQPALAQLWYILQVHLAVTGQVAPQKKFIESDRRRCGLRNRIAEIISPAVIGDEQAVANRRRTRQHLEVFGDNIFRQTRECR